MLQAVWFDAGRAEQGRLLVVAHHLVIDGVSWRILLGDLAAGWTAVRAGKPPKLDSVGTSLRRFARAFVEQAQEPVRLSELAYWAETLSPGGDLIPGALAAGTVSGTCHHGIRLSVSDTMPLLTSVPSETKADVTDVLLAALRVAVSRWHECHSRDGSVDLLVDLERHGREEIVPGVDLSRTVGWFTSIAPVRLPASPDVLSTLKVVKERLRAMPGGGIGYGMLRYTNAQVAPLLAGADQPQVLFNYLGRFDISWRDDWTRAAESDAVAADLDAEMGVPYPLTVNVICVDTFEGPQLQARFTFLTAVLSAEDAHELADTWATALRELMTRVTAGDGDGTLTPSDLSLLSLSQQEIDLLQQVSVAPVEDVWPLSPLQEGLLFHALFDEQDLDVYAVQLVFDLEGLLDAARLRVAAQVLLDRHSCLRTAFVLDIDLPVQVVVREVRVPWAEVDLSGWSPEDRSSRLERLVEDDRVARFDLQTPPLLRFMLVKIDETRHRLMISNHHILLDGWSMPLMLGELFALYASGGNGSALPRVRPYRDHLVWLSNRDRAAASAAWAQALKGIEGPTLLAAVDRARPPVMPEQVDASISEDLTSRLTSFVRDRGLTLNTLVQVAWAVVLSRAVGRLDVVFGMTVSGRPAELPGVESMLGLFINTVPVRVQLDPAESLVSLLSRIQDEQSRLLDHQYLGLTDVQRDAGFGILFDTLTVFESYPLDIAEMTRVLEGTGITLTGMKGRDSAHYPISLVTVPGVRLQITLDYRPDFFDVSTVRVLADRVVRVLETVAADPGVRAGEVDVLTAQERHQLLVEWNDTALEVPVAMFPEIFQNQVVRTPGETALVCGDSVLSFEELNAWANRLARHLVALGVGPERVVALVLPRSVEMIVALLAVLKAGGVYLPVDPELPGKRIRFVLGDAAPVLVVTISAGGKVADVVPQGTTWLVLDDPEICAVLEGYPDTDLIDSDRLGRLQPTSSAYVIYTSGSTGRPKGVIIEHRGLANLFYDHRTELIHPEAVAARDRLRVALTAAFSFDTSWEGLLFMADGHELHLINDDVRLDSQALVDYVAERRVDLLDRNSCNP
jgi:non-ribosomal peptide synthase protein (TIGR01720 family)